MGQKLRNEIRLESPERHNIDTDLVYCSKQKQSHEIDMTMVPSDSYASSLTEQIVCRKKKGEEATAFCRLGR